MISCPNGITALSHLHKLFNSHSQAPFDAAQLENSKRHLDEDVCSPVRSNTHSFCAMSFQGNHVNFRVIALK